MAHHAVLPGHPGKNVAGHPAQNVLVAQNGGRRSDNLPFLPYMRQKLDTPDPLVENFAAVLNHDETEVVLNGTARASTSQKSGQQIHLGHHGRFYEVDTDRVTSQNDGYVVSMYFCSHWV